MLLPPSLLPPVPAPMAVVESTPPFAVVRLANGLQLRFHDQTNRYFGDYHRVYIVVEIAVILNAEFIPDPELLDTGIRRFGERLVTMRVLERMGVAGDQVAAVRADLVTGYWHEVDEYLNRPEVPQRLLRAELANRPSASTILRMR